jgi:zinc protease
MAMRNVSIPNRRARAAAHGLQTRRAPLAVAIALSALCTGVATLRADDASRPAHPDQLVFQPLRFDAPKAADYRVKIGGGIVAYVVPDRSNPIVNVTVLMRIGPDLDPPGKEGLAETALYLMTRSGTKTHSVKDIEDHIGALGAQMGSGIGGGFGGRGGGGGGGGLGIGPTEASASINLLSKDVDEGLAILGECLRAPGWDLARLQLRKDQARQDMKQRNDDSAGIEQREWGVLLRGEDHWSNHWATAQSLAAITADDLASFHHRYVGPQNFILAVSGDFDRAEMVKKLEKAFAAWPQPGERPGPPPAPKSASTPGWFLIDKDVNQCRASIGLPAIDRYDPQWAATSLMNDILGGGGFSSRLVNRIRSDEGLAYSVRSSLEGGTYYKDPWRAAFQTKVRSTAYAAQIAFQEITRMRDTVVSNDELQSSKDKFIEAFPSRFETAASIAGVLAVDELTGRAVRDPKFYAEFRDRIRAVTAAQVQAAAQRLLDPSKMTVLLVGNAKDILAGDPKYPVTIQKLAGGEPKRLPLRDPLTMKVALTP